MEIGRSFHLANRMEGGPSLLAIRCLSVLVRPDCSEFPKVAGVFHMVPLIVVSAVVLVVVVVLVRTLVAVVVIRVQRDVP